MLTSPTKGVCHLGEVRVGGGGWGGVNCVFFHTCSEHRVEKSWEVPGMKGKVSSGVKDLRKVCVKEPQPDHTARS